MHAELSRGRFSRVRKSLMGSLLFAWMFYIYHFTLQGTEHGWKKKGRKMLRDGPEKLVYPLYCKGRS
jgi:hypothetical protein